jgi:hypothetical protein
MLSDPVPNIVKNTEPVPGMHPVPAISRLDARSRRYRAAHPPAPKGRRKFEMYTVLNEKLLFRTVG